jgi:hypothetical protein
MSELEDIWHDQEKHTPRESCSGPGPHIELLATEALRQCDLDPDQGDEDCIEACNEFFNEFEKAGFDTGRYDTMKADQTYMITDALTRMRKQRGEVK